MKRVFKEISPSERVKREKRWLMLGIFFSILCLSLIVTGCASNNALIVKENENIVYTCEDDKEYRIIKWTEKKLISDTCGKSKIEELR